MYKKHSLLMNAQQSFQINLKKY